MDGTKFYTSSTWRKVRERKILESGGVCSHCGRVFTDTSKLIVHHKKHLHGDDYNNPKVAYDDDNLEVICFDCHNKEHDRFKNIKHVHIVYGAPMSGKKTFVRQNKEKDDIVVDMDTLFQAITLNDLYDKPNALRFNVFGVRDCILDQIKVRYGNWRNAWIIGGFANAFDLQMAKDKVNADDVIFVDTSKEECILRLEASNDRDKNEWRKYIDKWFSDYTPHEK